MYQMELFATENEFFLNQKWKKNKNKNSILNQLLCNSINCICSVLTLSHLQTCMVYSRSRYGQNHSGYLGLNWSTPFCFLFFFKEKVEPNILLSSIKLVKMT